MATLKTTAHVSVERLGLPISPAGLPKFSFKLMERPRTLAVRCAVVPQDERPSRRLVSLAFLYLQPLFLPKDAIGGGIFDKYMKRKKLDPLETYVPAVILTELQIKELGNFLDVKEPKFADCRSLLRSGPAASFRVNIRAVAQYASDSSNSKSAFDDVDACLRSLEELDSLLLHASRNEPDASVESMRKKVTAALDALDSLLKTVPLEVLEKAKAIADAYIIPDYEDDVPPGNLDPELKQLESIL